MVLGRTRLPRSAAWSVGRDRPAARRRSSRLMPRAAQAASTWSRLMITTRPPRPISGRSGSSFMATLLWDIRADKSLHFASEPTNRPPSIRLREALRAGDGGKHRENFEFGFGDEIGHPPSDHLPSVAG